METVLITGGSGFVGRHLTALLQSQGYTVQWLGRKTDPESTIKQYTWDYKQGKIDPQAIRSADAIIHLAGASINGKKWNEPYKNEIYESRVNSTEFLFEKIKEIPNNIKLFTCSSATGFYGYAPSEKIFTESDLPGTDFLSKTCADWEKAAGLFREHGIRTCIVRSGIAFSENSEAYKKISLPIQLGFGAPVGSGAQFVPWIHTEDLCSIYANTIHDAAMEGIYNAVAPEFLTNKQMTVIMAKYYRKPLWLPNIPGFVLKLAFGEFSDSLLYGNRISAQKIKDTGFKFKYNNLKDFLQ